jgi:hypothetical protein
MSGCSLCTAGRYLAATQTPKSPLVCPEPAQNCYCTEEKIAEGGCSGGTVAESCYATATELECTGSGDVWTGAHQATAASLCADDNAGFAAHVIAIYGVGAANIGLGRIFALCYRSSSLYQIHSHIRYLYF